MVEIIEIVGILVLALTLFQAAHWVLGNVQRRKEEARLIQQRTQHFKQQAQRTFELAKLEHDQKSLNWNDWRKFEVAKIVQEAKGIKSFYLRAHDEKPIAPFRPGQFLTFRLEVPGQKQPVIRCYSLSQGAQGKDHYRVTIKHLAATGDQPAGVSSSYFHEKLKEGDILTVKAPSGHFYLDQTQPRPVVLIGAGIGLTPVFAMLETICATEPERECWLFYGVRNSDDLILLDRLREIADTCDNVRLVICQSQPDEMAKQGEDYDYAERISVDLFKRVLPSNNYQFYICGPGALMGSLTAQLAEWQVPDDDILFEAFGPSTVKKGGTSTDEKICHEVSFARSQVVCDWTGQQGSLLELAEENNVAAEAGCRAGNCGACVTAIKEGEVEYLVPPGAEPESGSCLLCISKPKGKLVLDV